MARVEHSLEKRCHTSIRGSPGGGSKPDDDLISNFKTEQKVFIALKNSIDFRKEFDKILKNYIEYHPQSVCKFRIFILICQFPKRALKNLWKFWNINAINVNYPENKIKSRKAWKYHFHKAHIINFFRKLKEICKTAFLMRM